MMRYAIYCLALPLLFSSCQKDPVINGIQEGYNFRMQEILSEDGRRLEMIITSTKEFPCHNYAITKNVTMGSNHIDIELLDIIEPNLCLTAIGPAKTVADLGLPESGTYSVRINTMGDISTGELIVSPDAYKLNLDERRGVNLIYSRLNRVPENTVWGLIGYNDTAGVPLVNNFLQTLENHGAEKKHFTPGHYHYFELDQDGKMLAPAYHGFHHAKPFIYQYPGDPSVMESVVMDFAAQYGDKLHISLYTDKGHEFMSWMY